LPSFILLYFLATTASQYQQHPWAIGIVHGLKLLAVVVVADATYGMSLTFCKEKMSMSIAVATAAVLMVAPSLVTQMLALGGAALLGIVIGREAESQPAKQARFSWPPLVLFGLLFTGLPLIAPLSSELEIFSDFYESGSLVFGGGHVVLPLLQQTLGDAIATDRFLVGYASAQAVPGPMFALAAFLGVELLPSMPLWGAIIATVGIFLPGILLVLSLQGAWEALAAKPRVAGAVWGINAAVVGLLLSALYQPIFVSAVDGPVDMAVVVLGFYALRVLKVPIVALVIGLGIVGVVL
jgi:chromate transporter